MADLFGSNGNGAPFRQYQNDPFDSTARRDPAAPFKSMPPNMGRAVVPHVWSFQGLVSSIAKTYRNPDEAYKHSQPNARFMRQDVGVMECLEARMRSTALLDWHIEVDGPDLPMHKALQERLTNIMRAIPRFTQYRYSLLEALWYGRFAAQHQYTWKMTSEGRDLIIKEWQPINGDKLVFRMDDGANDHPENQIGIRVGTQFKVNDLVYGRMVVPTEMGLATFLAPYERNMVTLHKHLIEDAAYEDPLDAGAINGIGIRSRIYWEWFQKQELLAMFMEYLERAALGFEIWYYPEGNPKAYADMKAAAENRNGRKTILMFPKPLGDDSMTYGVEHIEPNPAGAESFKEVLNNYFGHRIKRYILGQILTSEVEGTGLGSGVADLHLQTMLDIVKFDATNLEETITKQTLEPLKMWNDSQAHNVDVRFVIQTEQPDVEKKLASYEAAWNMGAKLKAADIMDAIGASVPENDEPFLQNPALAAQQLQNDMMAQQAQQQAEMAAMGIALPQPGQPGQPGQEQPGGGEEPGGEGGENPEEPGGNPGPGTYAAPGAAPSEAQIGAGVGHTQNIRQQLVQGLIARGFVSRNTQEGERTRYVNVADRYQYITDRYRLTNVPLPPSGVGEHFENIPSGPERPTRTPQQSMSQPAAPKQPELHNPMNMLSTLPKAPKVNRVQPLEADKKTGVLTEHGLERAAIQSEHLPLHPDDLERAAKFPPSEIPATTKGIRQMRKPKVFPKVPGRAGQAVPDVESIRNHMAKWQPEKIELDKSHPDHDPKKYKKMIDRMSDEAHWQAEEGNAPGAERWYSHGVDEAADITKDHLPEILDKDYPAHRHMFTALLAATSPVKPVPRNYHEAVIGFSHMLDNHDGKSAPQFPTEIPSTGKKFGVSTDAIRLMNHLVKEHWDANKHIADPLERRERTFQATVNWLHSKHHPWELWDMRQRATHTDPKTGKEHYIFSPDMKNPEERKNSLWGKFAPDEVKSLRKTAYGPSAPEYGHKIFGPKVGQFFSNLTGGKEGSTIDVHAVRNIMRHAGQMNDESRFSKGTTVQGEQKVRLPSVPKPGENRILQGVYRDVANRYNEKYRQGKEPYDDKAIQALHWLFEKGLYASLGYEKAEQPGFLQHGAYSFDREKHPRRPSGNHVSWHRRNGGSGNGGGEAAKIPAYVPPVNRHSRIYEPDWQYVN